MRQDANVPTHLQRTKQILAAVVFGSLFWLGYHYIDTLNQTPHQPEPSGEPPVIQPLIKDYNPEDPLLEVKLSRDRERSREIEQIQELLEKLSLSDEVRQQAERELWRLTQSTIKESELESLLKANGFNNTLATIGPNLVTLIIADKIQSQQVKLIGQMAAEVTSFKIDQIQIVQRENK